MNVSGFLFDLDGTLVDSAPDLVAVLNAMLAERGLAPVPYAIARNEVSNGAVGLLRLGFRLGADEPIDESLREQFLGAYADRVCVSSRLFLDIDAIDRLCAACNGKWGIVTNKPSGLTRALLSGLGIAERPACIVGGDTLARRKPHPEPLLHAAGALGIEPRRCVYLGDAVRDVEAGRNAGMRTIAVEYGYIPPQQSVADWRADAVARTPPAVMPLLARMSIAEPNDHD